MPLSKWALPAVQTRTIICVTDTPGYKHSGLKQTLLLLLQRKGEAKTYILWSGCKVSLAKIVYL